MSEKKRWVVLNFQAVAGDNDILDRKPGEALWPERFDLRYLARRRAEMGSRAFVALYQGQPSEATGNIFRRDQWRFYSTLPPFKRTVMTADTAFKVTSQSDFSVLQIWAEAVTGFYLLAQYRARLAYPDLRRLAISFYEQWKPEVVVIEDAASGQSLNQELRETTSLPLKPIKPDRDKVSRAESVTPLLEAGRVFLPESAAWINDFLDEMSAFPNGEHDDQVDAATMALNFLRGQHSTLGVIEFLKTGWNGFTNFFQSESPRPNFGKAAVFEVEKKLRGITKSNAGESWTLKAGPCPNCKSLCTVILSGTRHCNQCSVDFTAEGEVTQRPETPCCGSPLPRPVSGMVRCQNCGAQTFPDGRPAVTGGANRKDYLRGQTSGSVGMNFPWHRG